MLVFWRLSASFIAMSLASLVLVRLGFFEGYAIFLIGGAAALLIRRNPFDDSVPSKWFNAVLIAAVIFSAYVYTFATVEYNFGRDNGVYTIIANIVSEKGSVDVTVPNFKEIASHVSSRNGYPGIYSNPGGFHAQFNHMSPAFRGAFIDVFGEDGLALSSAFFAFIALLSFSVLGLSLTGSWGFLAIALLMTNASFIYVSRSTLTEVYALAFVGMAFYFARFSILEPRNIVSAIMLGLACGALMLTRVDGYLILPLVTLTVFFLLRKDGFRSAAAITIIAIVFTIWSYFDLRTYSRGYFSALFTRGIREVLAIGVFCLTASVALLAIYWTSLRGWLNHPRTDRLVWQAGKILVAVLFVVFFVYFIRGMFPAQEIAGKAVTFADRVAAFMRRAPIELTWYTTIPLALIAFAGARLLVGQGKGEEFAVAIAGILLIVAFIVHTRVSPDHPWNSRRWITFTIPIIFLLSAFFIGYLSNIWRILSIFLLIFIIPLYGWQQYNLLSNWIFVKLQKGYDAGYSELADDLSRRGEKFYYSTSAHASSAMTYIHKIDVVQLRARPVPGDPLVEIHGLPDVCAIIVQRYAASGFELFPPRLELRKECLSGPFYAYRDPEGAVKPDFISGWSHPEAWGTWTVGDVAAVSVRVPGGASSITVDGRGYAPKADFVQTVRIIVGGDQVGSMEFTKARPTQRSTFPLPKGTAGRTIIEFHVSNPISPAEAGVSSDRRILGFGLHKISIN